MLNSFFIVLAIVVLVCLVVFLWALRNNGEAADALTADTEPSPPAFPGTTDIRTVAEVDAYIKEQNAQGKPL